MRILQVTDSLEPGGAERVAIDLANGLAQRGLPVFFCASRSEGALRSELDAAVTFFCLFRKSRWDGLRRFRNYIIANQIDIVHAHGNSSASFCVLALLGLNVKIIHHDHNPVLTLRNVRIERWIIARCDRWIAVSSTIMSWVQKNVTKNVELIENPVRVEKFIYPVARPVKKRVNGILMANFRPQKDYSNLVRAMELYPASAFPFCVDCYGAHYNSDYRKEISRQIDAAHLQEKLKLNDSVSEVAIKLSHADLGLLASAEEGLPVSLLEYMAAALPVVVTDVGECGRIVRDSGGGVVVSRGQPELLAAAFAQLAGDPVLRKAMGERGRDYVIRHNSLDTFVDRIVALYGTL